MELKFAFLHLSSASSSSSPSLLASRITPQERLHQLSDGWAYYKPPAISKLHLSGRSSKPLEVSDELFFPPSTLSVHLNSKHFLC